MPTPEISEEAAAAVALIGADGTLVRATALFLDCCGTNGGFLSAHQEEIERVISSDGERTTLTIETGTADVSAVVTRSGDRHALVTISRPVLDGADDLAPCLASEPLDTSPAIVWLKDLSGRYLLVNSRYVEQLQTDSERVCGKTDDELAPGESIEGLHTLAGADRPAEPLEFEYTIPAAEGRPAFAVLRFALRNEDGEPTSVCGVAAPLARADVARSECARLMRLQRWHLGDESAAVSAVLEEWGLAAAGEAMGMPPPSPPPESPVSEGERDQFAAFVAELDAALATSARLERELTEERRQAVALREASILSARRAHEFLRTLSTERARTAELEEALSRARADHAELEGERDAERTRAETAEDGAAAAVAQERKIAENLSLELDDSREQLERLGAMLSAAPTADELESLRARADEAAVALEQAKAELATTATELRSEQHAVQCLREDLHAAQEEAVRARDAASDIVAQAPTPDDLAQERRRADQANAALAEARVRAEQSQAEKRSALSQAHGELRRARAESAEAAAALQSERQTVASLREEIAAVREELEGTQARVAERPTSEEFDRERSRAERALADAESALCQVREDLARSQAETTALSGALAAEQQTTAELRGALTDAGAELARLDGAARTSDGATLDALEQERTRAERAEAALDESRAQTAESVAAAEQAQKEACEAAAVVESLREEVERLRSELRELDGPRVAAQTSAGLADDNTETTPANQLRNSGPTWGAASQRALSAGLVEISEWRAALRHVVDTLGSKGGWDIAVAWYSDERRQSMKCAAVWTGGAAGLSTFETLTWQHRQRANGRGQSALRCVLDLENAENALLRAAAETGMSLAVQVPISDDNEVVGMLELFSPSVEEPSIEVILSLEGIALQLGAIARQLSSAHTPRWHFGRL